MSRSKLSGVSAIAAALLGCSSPAPDSQMMMTPPAPPPPGNYVALKAENFQKVVDGKKTDLFTIANDKGMFVKLSNFGARIVQVVVPDKAGTLGDIVIGYDSIDAVMTGQASAGAFMGRYANRIAGGHFTLDGTTYNLPLNDTPRPNTLHGGVKGARLRVFDAQTLSSASVLMSYTFADGEEGFPGTLSLQVIYTLTSDGALHLAYSATALDKKTIFNFTSHPFWNLSNQPGSVMLDHVVAVNADQVLEIDQNLIPTGKLRDVSGTPMDFRTPKAIGRDLMASYDLLMLAGGYDHTFVLNKSAPGRLSLAATVFEPNSGRTLNVFSTEPGMQLYSGNGFAAQSPRDLGKGGVLYPLHAGLAIEPMHYPDSPNQPAFPSTVLDPGETYSGEIVFQFGVRTGSPI